MMWNRSKIRSISYLTAAALALGLFGYARSQDLADARRAASYSASRAFEETVSAVDALSASLRKSLYATDGGMCARICSEAYAQAQAAESALSILPFSTQELEQISGFLNVAGDYAYSICSGAADAGFTPEQVDALTNMADAAETLVGSLLDLQGSVHGGDVVMDSPQLRLQNLQASSRPQNLSQRFLAFESAFDAPEIPEYDGQYGCAESEGRGYLTEEDMLDLAAGYAGVPAASLKEAYAYEGVNGRRCYRAGDLFLCVSRCGVESMAQSRLVGEALLGREEARSIAEDFLHQHDYLGLVLSKEALRGAVLDLDYARMEGDAVCPDNHVQIAIALDDGSVYSFNAAAYCGEESGARFTLDEEAAAQTLPDTLEQISCRKVILKSPGKRDVACYEFTCADENARQLRISVDAATGKQFRIDL